MGSATAWAATRRGLSVVVLEQFDIGHDHGSSHGSARIVRRAYPDPLYARLTGEAFELWRELEMDTHTSLVRLTGGLDYGLERDVGTIAATLAGLGIEHELIDAGEAQRRWSGMVFTGPVLYHPQAGTVDAAVAVRAATHRAVDRGAHVAARSRVLSMRVEGESAVVTTDRGVVRAPHVVVAAGAWLAPLMQGTGVGRLLPPLEVTQQQVFHFPHRPGVPEWPVAVHKEVLSTYSLPGGRDAGAAGGRKIAEHRPDGMHPTTAQHRDRLVDPAARRRIVEHVKQWLPGLEPTPYAESTCLYTSTPNEDFILDRVGPLVVSSACSGHGAKFAPLIGERAVDLATSARGGEHRFSLRAHTAQIS